MCLTSCLFCVEFLPFLSLVTIPLFGSFCGIDVVLRFSLLICINCLLGEYIPSVLYSVLPHLQVTILVILVLLPVNLTPWPIIWFYDKLLWLTEPVLLVAEVVQLLLWVLKLSELFSSRLESSAEDDVWKWKGLVIVLSAVCYCITLTLAVVLVLDESASSKWLVFGVFLLAIGVHNMMWMSNEGMIIDAAFVTLCSMAVLFIMKGEVNEIRHPVVPPDQWLHVDKSQSYIGLMYVMAMANMENARRAMIFLKMFLSPIFLISVVVRLCCILSLSDVVWNHFRKESTDEWDVDMMNEVTIETKMSPYKSPLALKLAVIFMFTQLVTQHLYECAGLYPIDTWTTLWAVLASVWPTNILIGRLLQVIAISGLYIYRLYKADDWSNDEWS